MKPQAILQHLHQHKSILGLSDWSISLNPKAPIEGDCYATVTPNTWEKTLEISLMPDFHKQSDNRQKNILLHELIHARVAIAQDKIKQHTEIEEEHLVNDLTRGIEDLLNKKFLKKPKTTNSKNKKNNKAHLRKQTES